MAEPINRCPETDIPYCPDCNTNTLQCEGTKGRDTETMGGDSVEYFYCIKCRGQFEEINGNITRSSS